MYLTGDEEEMDACVNGDGTVETVVMEGDSYRLRVRLTGA
jgi:hypothetical protein